MSHTDPSMGLPSGKSYLGIIFRLFLSQRKLNYMMTTLTNYALSGWLHILIKIHGIFICFGGKGYKISHLLLYGVVFLHNGIIGVVILCIVWCVPVIGIFLSTVCCLYHLGYQPCWYPKAGCILLLFWTCIFFFNWDTWLWISLGGLNVSLLSMWQSLFLRLVWDECLWSWY